MPQKKTHLIQLCTIIVLSVFTSSLALAVEKSKADANAEVYFKTPQDGAVVSNPVHIEFGVRNMTLIPAGTPHPYAGHHHLLIDVEELPDMDNPIPADANHKHFGKGQSETRLRLEPGEHTLQLLLGDHLHRPHDKPVVSEKITITVEAEDGE